MKKIKEIRIKNFKAFPDQENFVLDGKNLLVYGDNGSGKSSLNWAIHVFLNSCKKSDAELDEFFRTYNESIQGTHKGLKNINTTGDSLIEFEVREQNVMHDSVVGDIYKISDNNYAETQNDTLIEEVLEASDFIDYKLLQHFHDVSHKSEVDLWSVFERDVFPYFYKGSDNYNRYYENTDTVTKSAGQKFTQAKVKKVEGFDGDIEKLIGDITQKANQILLQQFKVDKYSIDLKYSRIYQPSPQAYSNPKILFSVKVKQNATDIIHKRPQSFLNEATLNIMAISIRLGALLTRGKTADWKVLVLDDVLISLDMSNRMIITDILLNHPNLKDFQKIIFTHERAFFNLLRNKTKRVDWKYLEFVRSNSATENPKIHIALSDLEKAQEYLDSNDLQACANRLRVEVENCIKKYLKKPEGGKFIQLSELIKQAISKSQATSIYEFKRLMTNKPIDIDKLMSYNTDPNLSQADKDNLKRFHDDAINFIVREYKKDYTMTKILQDIDEIKDRILNPLSHSSSAPFFRSEIEEALQYIELLRNEVEGLP